MSGNVLGRVSSERARAWLLASSLRLGQLAPDRLNQHADVLKPLVVSQRAPLKPTPVGPLHITPEHAAPLSVSNPAAVARKNPSLLPA
ncbi:hypothetical protein THH46_27930 [Pseudomonas sp. NA13]